MDTYVGTKVVQAETGRAPKQMGNHPAGEVGYKVVYEDGYESWSPKEVFENAYVKITNATDEHIMRCFNYDDIAGCEQAISAPFCYLAHQIYGMLPHCPDRRTALMKLLESRDAAVRVNK